MKGVENMIIKKIMRISNEIKDELIDIRRYIHAHPEIGHHEENTASLVAQKLKSLGLEVETNIGITGVVGILNGKLPGKTILLRADMDCLPMDELNEVEYKSKYPGLMHACGHDAHITWLLGAAMILSQLKNEIKGNIKFVFQPAEESPNGANSMIQDGVLENPHVDIAIGAHVWPEVETGKIAVKYGPAMASPDFFKITIYGKGGHGSLPHNCIDPILLGTQVYNSFLSIPVKLVSAIDPVVITVTKFVGGTTDNVIPDKVEMEGTVRTLSLEAREQLPNIMERSIKNIVEAQGGKYTFKYRSNTPPVINDEGMTGLVEASAIKVVGEKNVIRLSKPNMGGDDFSCFQQYVPGVYFFVGTYNEEKGITNSIHHPKFNVDEDILNKAAAVFAQIAIDYSNQ